MPKLIIEDKESAYKHIRSNPPAWVPHRHKGIWKSVVDKDKHYSYGAAVSAFKKHMKVNRNIHAGFNY
jgi:hypothetical protein